MEKKRKKHEWFNFNRAIVLIIIIALFIILRTAFTPSETVELLEDTKSELAKVVICEEADDIGQCDSVGDFDLTQEQCCTFAEVCCPP